MFYDSAKIFLKSGDGGNGAISFRREKYVPFGGPDGGDGGDGGSIIFKVNPKLNSLGKYQHKKHFSADNGENGGTNGCTGGKGDDLILEVPAGTLLRDVESGQLLADLTLPDDEIQLVPGGVGGRGNSRFATSVNQAPRIAEKGVAGKSFWVEMELKLIADVGLVGKPNAGKSTLLSVISSARPKIANYPFTTLQPNLGVVTIDDFETIVVADIPGLIEGAAEGIGLGHDFLRHIERTRVLIHLLDGSAEHPLDDFNAINQELALYNIGLTQKPQIVVLNKIDLPDAVAWEPIIAEEIEAIGYPFFAISAVTGQGVRTLLRHVYQTVQTLPIPQPAIEVDELPVIRAEQDANLFTVERIGEGKWRVVGNKVERITAQTYFESWQSADRFQRILQRLGISRALEDAGVRDGDLVQLGEIELEWQEE